MSLKWQLVSHLCDIWLKSGAKVTELWKLGLSSKISLRLNELVHLMKTVDIWQWKGIQYVEDCYENGHFVSFEQLRSKCNLPNKHCDLFLEQAQALKLLWLMQRLVHHGKNVFLKHEPCYRIRVQSQLCKNQEWIYILMNTSGQIYAIIVCQLQLIPNADLPLSAHLTPQKLHKSKPKFSDMYFKCGWQATLVCFVLEHSGMHESLNKDFNKINSSLRLDQSWCWKYNNRSHPVC